MGGCSWTPPPGRDTAELDLIARELAGVWDRLLEVAAHARGLAAATDWQARAATAFHERAERWVGEVSGMHCLAESARLAAVAAARDAACAAIRGSSPGERRPRDPRGRRRRRRHRDAAPRRRRIHRRARRPRAIAAPDRRAADCSLVAARPCRRCGDARRRCCRPDSARRSTVPRAWSPSFARRRRLRAGRAERARARRRWPVTRERGALDRADGRCSRSSPTRCGAPRVSSGSGR